MANKGDVKAVKKAQREAKRAKRKQTWGQMKQAFVLLKGRDKWLIPLLIAAFVVPIVLLLLIGVALGGFWAWILPIMGIPLGVTAAMWLFSRRLQNSFYAEAEGQAGAAAWTLDNMRSGVGITWNVKTGVVANQHMDAVHRVVGNPGIVLVGEGDEDRVRKMMAKEKRALARIVGETPIYEVMSGSEEGQVPPKKLQRELLRFPRNYNKDEANALATKLQTMDANRDARANLPKGPLPGGGAQNMAGMNRKARRAAQRKKRS
ncbi:DUF4191 domain-containing protein [Corynebacterium sp. TAE3-ERU12]|uniref:DUF4191 domain-containing protein n=1 Tax=Corynebacterium sp. TAE3-ERU12 TaxID=2849491 RepID=UPI001C44F2B2|nr:DUF4191 domain-containing protein [Corynebacterium sp. TAE3-ERU12]MBV7295833.1 DUF4191 domain-containing protein [Corynebacterium sp. TAE3-ERU12]